MKVSNGITRRSRITRCRRCRRRMRHPNGWNVEMIAGIEAGYLCPECQTIEEDLEAELNLTLGRSSAAEGFTVNSGDDLTDERLDEITNSLIRTYPTPEIMRVKADRLAQARGNRHWMVGIMRRTADNMDSGMLFDG